jgi:hypothetical protein
MVKRWISPSLFALAALAFLLPFATVSCDGAKTSFSGIQLVTHTVPAGGMVDEAGDCSADLSTCIEHETSTAAGLALLAALVGVGLGYLGVVRGPGWCATVALGALAYLPLADPLVDEQLHSGYVLSFAFLLAAGVLHAGRAFGRLRRRRRVGSTRECRAGAPG